MRSRWDPPLGSARYWRRPCVRPWRHRLATATSCARSPRHCVLPRRPCEAPLRQLRGIAQPGSLWCGEAKGRAFSAKLAEPSEAHLDEVPARYEGYAAALSSYAVQVDEAHRDLVAAQSAAADAVRAYGVIVARARRAALGRSPRRRAGVFARSRPI